jgi:hypothetical protein
MNRSQLGPGRWATLGLGQGEVACHMDSGRNALILAALSCSSLVSMGAAASILILMLIILSISAYTTPGVGRRSGSCSWPGSPGALDAYWMACIRLRPRSTMWYPIGAILLNSLRASCNRSVRLATPGRPIGSSGVGGKKVIGWGATSGRGLPHELFSIFEHFSGR